MTGHTKGDLHALRDGIEIQSEDGNHEVLAYVDGIPVCVASVISEMHVEHDDPVGEYHLCKDEGLANLRRIVACWNACAGLSTELIEQGGFAAVPVATHRTIVAQRDELVAALNAARAAHVLRTWDEETLTLIDAVIESART